MCIHNKGIAFFIKKTYNIIRENKAHSKGRESMDIAALSMAMAQNDIGTKVGVAVLDKSLDTAENVGAQLVQMIDSAAMQRSVTPHIGGNIDISV